MKHKIFPNLPHNFLTEQQKEKCQVMNTNIDAIFSQKEIDNLCLDTVKGIFHSNGCGVAGHQIREFDYFVEHDINQTLSHLAPVSAMCTLREPQQYKYSITFNQAYLGKPANLFVHDKDDNQIPILTPNQARINNINYSSTLFIDTTFTKTNQETGDITILEQRLLPFGRIPIMIGSSRCHTWGMSAEERIAIRECVKDVGGYFIINGAEKVLMGQERSLTHNLVYVSPIGGSGQNFFTHKAEIRCIPEKGRNANRTSNTSVCFTKTTGVTQLQSVASDRTASVRVILPQLLKIRLPIVILFRALGCCNEKTIYEHLSFLPKKMFEYCLGEAGVAMSSTSKGKHTDLFPSLLNIHREANTEADEQITRDALHYIGKQSLLSRQKADSAIDHSETYFVNRAKDLLANELFPQISVYYTMEANKKKMHFLSYMVKTFRYTISTFHIS